MFIRFFDSPLKLKRVPLPTERKGRSSSIGPRLR